MPWKEVNKMSLKREFISLFLKNTIPVNQLCDRFKIARQTGYKWIRRYQKYGEEGLQELSRKPKHLPNETAPELVNQIIDIREKHPRWGGRKIHAVMANMNIGPIPAASTISDILKRNGYISDDKRSKNKYIRFEHESANALWQMDFKGHFPFAKGRCHPLTIIDDRSRFAACLKACANEKRETVKESLIEVFEKYGVPNRINVDNGPPWGASFHSCRYTLLSIWLIELGIKVSYSRPRHPQTNGKNERFNRTLKEEVLQSGYFGSLCEIQRRFDEWKEIYNHERPHEALEMAVPASIYEPSYRSYDPDIREYNYESDYLIRKVDLRGRLHLFGKRIFVGIPFTGKLIGIRDTIEDGVKEIYFRHQLLGRIDLSLLTKNRDIHNLYANLKKR